MSTIIVAAWPAPVTVATTPLPGSDAARGMAVATRPSAFGVGTDVRTRDAKQAAPPRGELR